VAWQAKGNNPIVFSMKRLLLYALLAATVLPALADSRLALVQPQASGMLLAKRGQDGNPDAPYAEFKGRPWVTGTLVAQWIVGVDEEEANTFDVRLVPDKKAVKLLPYFSGYPVEDIIPENPKAALKMAFDVKTLGRLERKEILVARAIGTFQVTRYRVAVDCDAPWSQAMILKAKIPKAPLRAAAPYSTGCV
jgi:hypothetical protein